MVLLCRRRCQFLVLDFQLLVVMMLEQLCLPLCLSFASLKGAHLTSGMVHPWRWLRNPDEPALFRLDLAEGLVVWTVVVWEPVRMELVRVEYEPGQWEE